MVLTEGRMERGKVGRLYGAMIICVLGVLVARSGYPSERVNVVIFVIDVSSSMVVDRPTEEGYDNLFEEVKDRIRTQLITMPDYCRVVIIPFADFEFRLGPLDFASAFPGTKTKAGEKGKPRTLVEEVWETGAIVKIPPLKESRRRDAIEYLKKLQAKRESTDYFDCYKSIYRFFALVLAKYKVRRFSVDVRLYSDRVDSACPPPGALEFPEGTPQEEIERRKEEARKKYDEARNDLVEFAKKLKLRYKFPDWGGVDIVDVDIGQGYDPAPPNGAIQSGDVPTTRPVAFRAISLSVYPLFWDFGNATEKLNKGEPLSLRLVVSYDSRRAMGKELGLRASCSHREVVLSTQPTVITITDRPYYETGLVLVKPLDVRELEHGVYRGTLVPWSGEQEIEVLSEVEFRFRYGLRKVGMSLLKMEALGGRFSGHSLALSLSQQPVVVERDFERVLEFAVDARELVPGDSVDVGVDYDRTLGEECVFVGTAKGAIKENSIKITKGQPKKLFVRVRLSKDLLRRLCETRGTGLRGLTKLSDMKVVFKPSTDVSVSIAFGSQQRGIRELSFALSARLPSPVWLGVLKIVVLVVGLFAIFYIIYPPVVRFGGIPLPGIGARVNLECGGMSVDLTTASKKKGKGLLGIFGSHWSRNRLTVGGPSQDVDIGLQECVFMISRYFFGGVRIRAGGGNKISLNDEVIGGTTEVEIHPGAEFVAKGKRFRIGTE